MGRSPCCAKEGLNRGAWTATEDRILTEYIKVHGEGKWRNLPKKAGLKRCGKSCRLRWLNYLRPDIKRGNITHDEEELIIRLHKLLGNRWSLIAGRLPGRTDNEIKNYWNSNIGKKIMQGHPISTPNHKTNPRSPPPPPPLVHHTKPSRCTKVFFPSTEPAPVKHQVIETPSIVQDLANPSENDGNPSDNFFPEFEMDVNFISEFLNSDNFSQLCDFHSGVEADSINTSNTISSTTHDQYYSSPLLINEETLQNPNLFSIDSFLDSEMDWFV